MTTDLLDLTTVKKRVFARNTLFHCRLQLHVIEELEAVAKFSELREKSKTQYVILGVI